MDQRVPEQQVPILLRHDGQITCDSTLGEGTRFTVALPRADQDEASAHEHF